MENFPEEKRGNTAPVQRRSLLLGIVLGVIFAFSGTLLVSGKIGSLDLSQTALVLTETFSDAFGFGGKDEKVIEIPLEDKFFEEDSSLSDSHIDNGGGASSPIRSAGSSEKEKVETTKKSAPKSNSETKSIATAKKTDATSEEETAKAINEDSKKKRSFSVGASMWI